MTVVITHPSGSITVLPHIHGVAVSTDDVLMLILPNGHLIERTPDRWSDIHLRREAAPGATIKHDSTLPTTDRAAGAAGPTKEGQQC